jgi:hypothetical protein
MGTDCPCSGETEGGRCSYFFAVVAIHQGTAVSRHVEAVYVSQSAVTIEAQAQVAMGQGGNMVDWQA